MIRAKLNPQPERIYSKCVKSMVNFHKNDINETIFTSYFFSALNPFLQKIIEEFCFQNFEQKYKYFFSFLESELVLEILKNLKPLM